MAVRAAMVELRSARNASTALYGVGKRAGHTRRFRGGAQRKLELAQSQRAGLQRYNKTARGSFAVDGAHPIDWVGLGYFFSLLVSYCR